MPTSVWTKTSPVDIHQIYTRLSWVKEEQTPVGPLQSELTHYTEIFTENEKGVVPKRILVQGQTGIGKSTFVKKLAVDWAELDGPQKTSQREKDVLKRFELLIAVNLKEVPRCQSLRDVISRSHIFPREEKPLTDSLLNYITNNQENILLVFDGYDEYRSGINSEIYEIFRGNSLRDCCVVITTRSSKADELRGFQDVYAEITGFSTEDTSAFMNRMLGGETEAKELKRHLSQKNLEGLTRIPLLLLFFCTLWKKGRLKSFPENKTKLYLVVVQYILDYSQGKHSPTHFSKVEDYKEILIEIGKVALEGLLKDDHVFEYDQLSAIIRCEESLFLGLLQVTEYAENLRPAGMVSFIHKSIQEFLAAWYVTYKCVPEGNLGGIEHCTYTLEDCMAFENVFYFICGLSDDGAVKIFSHLTLVRINDQALDLSATIPDLENETELPLCDVTDRQKWFSDLVFDSYQEVGSKAELLRNCFDCIGQMVLITRPLSKLLPKMEELTQVTHSRVFLFPRLKKLSQSKTFVSVLYDSLEFLDCLRIPLRISESSKIFKIEDLLRTYQSVDCDHLCGFSSMLCFHNGQFQFYITDLELECHAHGRLFSEIASISVPSHSAYVCPEHSCLRFLTSLHCFERLSGEIMKDVGALIRNCGQLKMVELQKMDDSICDLLEQVPKPSSCYLKIGVGTFRAGSSALTSFGAVKLAGLLPRFKNAIALKLDLSDCCASALNTLVPSITHTTLQELRLVKINLTPGTAAALGRSLPEMLSLRELELTGVDGSILLAKEMKALFGGFDKALPLEVLDFRQFNVRGRLDSLTKSFKFLPDLRELFLNQLNMDEHDFCGLLESLRFIPNLKTLIVWRNPLGHTDNYTAKVNPLVPGITQQTLERLRLMGISLTPAAAAALGRLLPAMSSLRELEINGVDGCILQAEEMETLFGGFEQTLPLESFTFSGLSSRDGLAPLAKSLRFFPNLRVLNLVRLDMNERDFGDLLQGLKFIPNLRTLRLSGNPLGHAVTHIVQYITHLPRLRHLHIPETGCSKEDIQTVREAVSHVGVWRY